MRQIIEVIRDNKMTKIFQKRVIFKILTEDKKGIRCRLFPFSLDILIKKLFFNSCLFSF